MKPRIFLAALLVVLGLAAGLHAAPPPNILFILADDLGINDLACYGRADHRTPNLDRLAREGTRFTSAYVAQSLCSPSRAALMTGKHPARLQFTTFLPGRADAPSQKLLHPLIRQRLPLAEVTLGERLRAAGYATAYFGKWHLGGQGFGPVEQGFDFHHAGRANTPPSAEEGGKGEYDLTTQALRFIETNRPGPFLVFLAHNSPHIPCAARADLVARRQSAFEPVYAAVIETLDDTVGRLLTRLDELGLAANTLVVFTSDNGGLHVPEGPHPRVTHNTPFRAGKGFLYEGGLRVPQIVRWPGRVPAGRVTDAPMVLTDWLPTLAEIAGQPAPAGLDGVSFARFLQGRGRAPARPLFWHFPHYANQGGTPGGALRDGPWKLIEYYEDNRVELYRLDRDPGESRDLAAGEPARAAAMRSRLAAWRIAVGAQTNAPNPAFDPALHRPLYVAPDPSRFAPANAPDAEWARMQEWRRDMGAAPRAAPRPPAPPNVLLIISDDQAWGDYGFMGHPHIQTPHLDRLARESLTFTRGYSPVPLCRPSLSSIATGLFPHQHGVTGNDPALPDKTVNAMAQRTNPQFARYYGTIIRNFAARPNLVRDLTGRGYLALQTGKWWEGDPVKTAGFTHAMTQGEGRNGRHGDAGLDIGRKGLDPIGRFLDQAAGKPWLIWYAPMLPHAPHTPPDDLLQKYLPLAPGEPVARYWASVEWFDRTCGELLAELERRGLRDNTIILYTTDNGWVQAPGAANRFAPRSKNTSYEGGVRTPILVSWRGHVAPRFDTEHLACNLDLWPTLAALLGAPAPPGLPGLNLTDTRAVAARAAVFGEQYHHDVADVDQPTRSLETRWMIEGWWKLIAPNPATQPGPRAELYDLRHDPWETNNLARTEARRVKQLTRRLDAWWKPGQSP